MKNLTIIFGSICIALLLLGSLFKIQHWPMAGMMLTISLTSLSIICYLLFAILRRQKEGSGIMYYLGAGIFSLIPLAILFRIQHWPMGGMMLTLGILGIVFVFFPLFLIHNSKHSSDKLRDFGMVVMFIIIGVVYLAIAAKNFSAPILDKFSQTNNDRIKNEQYLQELNEGLYSQVIIIDSNDTNAITENIQKLLSVKKESDKMYLFIKQLKNDIITYTGGWSENGEIRGIKDFETVTRILVDEGHGDELHLKLQTYKEFLISQISFSDEELGHLIKDNFKYRARDPSRSWAEETFHMSPLIAVIAKFSDIQYKVRLLEGEVIESLISSQINEVSAIDSLI